MTTYSEQAFDSSNYNSARPTYPDQFYKTLVAFHKAHSGNVTSLAMDVFTGPGFVAFHLTKYFDHVIGTDLSATMIAECKSRRNQWPENGKIEFHTAPAEKSPDFVAALSVDVITAAEACHWMDHPRFFAECARVLKRGGTLAYWFYLDPVFVDCPAATEIHRKYSWDSSVEKEGSDYEKYFGPLYEQPGHDLYGDAMSTVSPPGELFSHVTRLYYHPYEHGREHTTLFIEKKLTLKTYRALIHSWSGYHNWKKQYPDKPDAADQLVAEVSQALGIHDDMAPIDIIFPTVYTFARKK
ncbi:S-adenosyl-L-methionine-dependent methyltransferase [Metschnikowia bicuspidata var. bicuspidata NRRL YB-4993]|uniref:S-adenosyl-L-methionine-dependent methyltransferase n=1 Tax=Metschnikowia bicuspidata var. bicuspidata NRRL YB-4993 TaxID=869754 RepID=A0A1A0HDL4_9ASCO|nr:S-adenosyl-L-methionine-dependent methyltransferase [Metschnikowia bicuspidata var. bicuspidata NRRL YB-4993]OBA22174.1 S-adenosyl-L-methionine-dependent methyltransferase [Metschnikowia bicuspidata var. bicuspidata NRRL YB-4993]